MPFSHSTVPLRWQSGPLEIARQSKAEGFSQTARQTLERWHDPATLEFLKGSPVDCLVISWAGGLPQDSIQQTTAAALISEAHRRSLSVVGWVEGKLDSAAIASAKSAGLDAVALEGFSGHSDFPVIAWGERAKAPWDATSPVLAVTDNLWPGVRLSGAAGGAADVEAGPTATPWLNSNGWYAQLAGARVQKPIWMFFDPPGKGTVITEQGYQLAVSDAEAAGAHWAISLDDDLRAALAAGDDRARGPWKAIGDAVSFFAQHKAWRGYRSLGLVGVISDFAGDNYDLSGEILNLMARRDLLFRVLWKSGAAAAPFTGLKALVYADHAAPPQELRQKMLGFAAQGGCLIAGPKWGNEGTRIARESHPRYELRSLGKGRLAIAKEELIDPFEIAGDVNILVGYANNLVKFFNSSSSGCSHYTGSPDGKSALLQGLSFSGSGRRGGGTGGLRTVWLGNRHRSARLWTIGSDRGLPLQARPADDYPGEEYGLPLSAAQGYIALELEV